MRKLTILFVVGITACLFIAICAMSFYNSLFPKAAPINPPGKETIVSIGVSANMIDVPHCVDKSQYDGLIQSIQNAKPTRSQSLNDTPTTADYYKIVIRTNDKEYHSFIYNSEGQAYVEIPYSGIYEVDMSLLESVRSYCNSGD